MTLATTYLSAVTEVSAMSAKVLVGRPNG